MMSAIVVGVSPEMSVAVLSLGDESEQALSKISPAARQHARNVVLFTALVLTTHPILGRAGGGASQ